MPYLASFDHFIIDVELTYLNILDNFSPRKMKFSGCQFLDKSNKSEYRHRCRISPSFDHFIIDVELTYLNILNNFSPSRMKFSGCKFLDKTNKSEYRHR